MLTVFSPGIVNLKDGLSESRAETPRNGSGRVPIFRSDLNLIGLGLLSINY